MATKKKTTKKKTKKRSADACLRLTLAEMAVVGDAVDAWEEIAEEDVAAGERPAAYLDNYKSARRKIARP